MRTVVAAASAFAITGALVLVAAAPTAIAQPYDAGAPADAGDAGASPVPACMSVSTSSRYVPWGYNHIVILRNGCSKTARCMVSTDVNPAAQIVEVAAGATVEVTTFMGSPAYVFVARVRCTLL
jgi:hypothetical protein